MAGTINPDNNSLNFIQKYVHFPNEEKLKLTSIVILTYNQLAYTKLCIESIRKFTPKNTYELIVVDNNSNDGTVEWLKDQKDIKAIFNSENKGFPAGCNQGVEVSNGENVLFLNNDVIVTPNWLNNLQEALYSSDEIGVVGAITNSCSNYQQIDVNYNNIAEMVKFAEEFNVSNKDAWDYKIKLIGYCYLVKKEVLDKVGLFDEIFSPGNFEDDDLSYRILQNDYKLLLCKDTFIHHFGSVSFSNEGKKFADVFYANQKKIKEKWGFDPTYSSGIRVDLLNLMETESTKPINVLEIGCGVGATLLEIKNRYKNSTVYGLEISKGAGSIAEHICEAIIGNVETMELPYKENFFDYIILGDVLEHLIDPWSVLEKIRKCLKKDGFILASIPNIMHYTILKHILYGGFTYTDAGILDRTHLRFFTLHEIQNLFNSTNYNLVAISANGTYISPEDEEFLNQLCSISNENLRQQYISYQFLIKAAIKPDLSKYDSKEMNDLKFKLMRLDNNIDVSDSLDFIFDAYQKNSKDFLIDINFLINSYIINKNDVLETIKSEALDRNLLELANEISKQLSVNK